MESRKSTDDSPKIPGEKGLNYFLRRIPLSQQQKYRNGLFDVSREDLVGVSEK